MSLCLLSVYCEVPRRLAVSTGVIVGRIATTNITTTTTTTINIIIIAAAIQIVADIADVADVAVVRHVVLVMAGRALSAAHKIVHVIAGIEKSRVPVVDDVIQPAIVIVRLILVCLLSKSLSNRLSVRLSVRLKQRVS